MKYVKKHLIGVVMDGIRDTDMIAGYAEAAREEGEDKFASWFAVRAKERLAALRRDWVEVQDVLKLKSMAMRLSAECVCT
jgi:hypothetical protein